jgi:hypothetical protein
MKAKEWDVASQPLAEVLQGFRRMKRGFVRFTSDWTAACIYADNSGFSSGFYLDAFAMPLFVESRYLAGTNSLRIGGIWDRIDDETVAAVRQAVPKLVKLADLKTMVRDSPRWKIDLHHAEVRLGAGILLKDRRLVSDVREGLRGFRAEERWEHEAFDRCQQLLAILDAGGEGAAVAELERRREVTVSILR